MTDDSNLSTSSSTDNSSSTTTKATTDEEGSSSIKRLLGFIFLFYLSFGIINPVNIELFEKINSVGSTDGTHSKHSASLFGALFALPGLIFFFVSPVIGNLSDRLGRKLFLTLFALCYTITFGIYYLLCHVVTKPDEELNEMFIYVKYNGLKFYIIAKIIQGCSLDIIPLCNSFIADNSKKEDFATYFSFILAAMGLATAIGPIMSGFVAKNFGMTQVFQLIFVTSSFTTLFVANFVKETAKNHATQQQETSLIEKVTTPFKSLYNILSQGDSVLISLIISKLLSSFISVGFFCIVTQFTRIKYSFGPTENGYVLTLIGITAILSNSILSKLIMYLSKGKETNGLIISGLANALFFLSFVVCGNGAYVYYGTVFFLFGAKEDPLRSALISKVFNDPNQQGVLNGCLGSISTVGRVVSPIIFSSLLDIFTTSETMPRIVDAPFIALTITQVLCVAFVFRAKHLIEKNKGE